MCKAFLIKKWLKQVKNVKKSEFLEPASFLFGVFRASRNSEIIIYDIRKSYRTPHCSIFTRTTLYCKILFQISFSATNYGGWY